ncbi:type II CAAX endopeptidase family protein [Alkalibacterium indicireducens]|uniref:Type II CAAX endopeptidase family protein n=1 Tax=Alkalibacterium indicireducens TaxID=398758 RepID=A0ABP3KMB5_9LACT
MSVNDINKKAAINMISLFLAVQLVSAVIPLFLPEDTGIVGFLLPSMVLFSLGAIGMIVIERRQQMKFEFEERFSNNTASILLWGLIGMFIAIVVQTFASIIEVNFLGSSMESENTQFIMEVVRNYPLFLLLVGIAGPVMEEFVFRKAMFGLLIDRIGGIGAAVISSLLFAFIHFDGLLLVYSSMGLVFAWLYFKTKNIWTPILAHCLMNVAAVLINLYFS